MKSWLAGCMGVWMVAACAGTAENAGVEEVAAWLTSTPAVQVVDVRQPDEFAHGHLNGAILVPWGGGDFENQILTKISNNKPVLVYCRSGRRSSAAAEVLVRLGFSPLKNLDGGIMAWQAAGKPVTTR